jgi:hypothetical protein
MNPKSCVFFTPWPVTTLNVTKEREGKYYINTNYLVARRKEKE